MYIESFIKYISEFTLLLAKSDMVSEKLLVPKVRVEYGMAHIAVATMIRRFD